MRVIKYRCTICDNCIEFLERWRPLRDLSHLIKVSQNQNDCQDIYDRLMALKREFPCITWN